MRRALRLLLVLCLAAAVPMQGMAAAFMGACGSTSDAAASHREATTASHHDAMAAHDHDGADHAMPSSSSMQGKACSVCCLAPAMPAPRLVFDTAAPTERAAHHPVTVAVAFLTAGPDRPPRRVLA